MDDFKCVECGESIDRDKDCYVFSVQADGPLCEADLQSDEMYASTVLLYGPDWQTDGDPCKVYVGDHVIREAAYGDDFDALSIKRRYVSTDAWRGYHETSIEGWVSVGLEGWTTGAWGDAVSARKAAFNEWAESLSEDVAPVNFAIVCDPTSNVFSTAISVLAPEDAVEGFQAWVDDLAGLSEALS